MYGKRQACNLARNDPNNKHTWEDYRQKQNHFVKEDIMIKAFITAVKFLIGTHFVNSNLSRCCYEVVKIAR